MGSIAKTSAKTKADMDGEEKAATAGSGCDDRLTVSWREAALRSTFHASFMKPWRTLFCDSKDNTFTGILSFL